MSNIQYSGIYLGMEKIKCVSLNPVVRPSRKMINFLMKCNIIYATVLIIAISYYNVAVFVYRKPELVTIIISLLAVIADISFPTEAVFFTYIVFSFHLVPIALLPISMDYITSQNESGAFMIALGLIGFIYATFTDHTFCIHMAVLSGLSSGGMALSIAPHINLQYKCLWFTALAIFHFI